MAKKDASYGKIGERQHVHHAVFLQTGQLLSAGLSAVYSTMPIAMLILILGIYGSLGGEFKPSIVFTALTLMDMVRGPLITISQVLNAILVDGKTVAKGSKSPIGLCDHAFRG